MKEIITEIIIQAPKEKVWQVMTDLEAYQEWNPFLVASEGKLKVGERLKNTMVLDGATQVFKPIITVLDKNQKFEWLGGLPLNIFNGRHYFILEDLGNGLTKLIHGEKFTGFLHKFIINKIGESTRQGFINWNRALKERVETA